MPKIIIKNKICRIIEDNDTDFLRALYDELSFDVQGAQYTQAFKGYSTKSGDWIRWDGKKRLLTENLEFEYGLLERVKEHYALSNREVEIVDNRPAKTESTPIDISEKLKEIGKEPRPYQLDTVEAAKNSDCGIIKIPTGGGKSLVAALITAEFGKPANIYVIGIDLLYQFHALFKSIFGDDNVGIVGDGLCDVKKINIVSVWTAGQVLGLKKSDIIIDSSDDSEKLDPQKYEDIKKCLVDAKVHICDECHLGASATFGALSQAIRPEHIYGMSGTPWRDDGADLMIEAILGKYIVNIKASTLIDQGYLVPPIIKFIPVEPLKYKVTKQYQTIYKEYIVENDIRNELVVKATQKLVEQGFQTLVLFKKIDHGKVLFEKISKIMPCILLSGKDDIKTRESAKSELEAGRINCIIASQIFDIGVDLPSLSGLVIAGSGKSSVRALQRIGRVIRKHPNKKYAAIIDFVDQADFLLAHSKTRRKIYESEERFKVIWPSKSKRKK